MRKYNSSDRPQHPIQDNDELKSQQQSYFQNLLQSYMQTNPNSLPFMPQLPQASVSAHPQHQHQNCEPHSCSSGMISSLFSIVTQQANHLQSLNQKVEQMVDRNRSLARRLIELQNQNEALKGDRKKQATDAQWKEAGNDVKVEGQSVNKQSLIQILFGKQKYQYKLRLAKDLDQPLYRERNFCIDMELVDMNDERVPNSNKIPMSLALYTCQNPPKFIEKNTTGQKMLKGYVDQALLNGVCRFEKVQIREVTSHYRGGWIFLVAIPCMTPLGSNKSDNFVSYTKIKPLAIDDVIVKAKKPKKKGQKDEKDDKDLKKQEFSEEQN